MGEIYFAFPQQPRDAIKEMRGLDYVDRMYSSSFLNQKVKRLGRPKKERGSAMHPQNSEGFYLVGVAHRDFHMIPYHNGVDNFNVPVESVLSEYKKEPTYISIMWLREALNKPKLAMLKKFIQELSGEGGLSYKMFFYPVGCKTIQKRPEKFQSKIIRVALSEKGSYKPMGFPQAIILELDGNQKSAKEVVDKTKDNIEKRIKCQVADVKNFCLIDSNIKNSAADQPSAPSVEREK